VVLIEHGGSGPAVAAPMAMQIIREYERMQAARAGRPIPRAYVATSRDANGKLFVNKARSP